MTDESGIQISAARVALVAARKLLNDEISGYPTPIAGCAAQFNHLLGELQRVLAAIRALEETLFVPTPRTPTADVERR